MAVKTKHVRAQRYSLPPLKYGDDELNIIFYKNAYTPRLEQESRTVDTTTIDIVLIRMLLPVLADWDFYNDYEVYHYVKYTGDDTDVLNSPKRFFVINGKGGKIGEYYEYIPRDEIDNHQISASVIYKLEPLYEEGQQIIEERIVPITEQGLLDIPLTVMTDILTAIGDFVRPGEVKSSNSDSSFS